MAKGMSFKVLMQLQTKEFQKGIKNIQRQLRGFAGFIKNAFALGSVTMFGKQLVQVGKDFENAMARVQSVSNATQEEMKKMTAEAERLGSTTRYTATEAANALENLTRNGLKASDATKVLSSVLQLAQANSIELADAANIVTNTLNMFNLGVNQASRVNDVLSSTASHAATDINLLYEAMVNAAPAANVLGFSIEETASAIGALAQRGVKGSEAGTKLRIAFQKMADPKVIAKMKEQGIEVDENTMKAEGLRKTIEKIARANLSLGQLGKIFDAKSAMAVQQLVASLNDLDYMLDVTANSAGETERMFNQSVGSVQRELDTLKSMYEGLLISISKKTSGMVKTVVKLLQNLISNFNTVGGTIRNIAVVAVPLLTKRVLQLATTMKTAFAQIAAGATTVKAALGGWVSIIATIVTWVGSYLWGAWERSTKAMRDANKQLKDSEISAKNMQEAVDNLKNKIGDGSNAGSLNYAIKRAIELFPEFADAINNAKRIAEKTGEWDKLKKVLQDIADLQALVTMKDAKQAVANAQAQKMGMQMYKDATRWFALPYDDNARKYSVGESINSTLKSQGFTKDQIKEIFKQLASTYASEKDSYEGYKAVEKFLKGYSIEFDYDSLSRWLNNYNSDFADLGGPLGTGNRRSNTGDLKKTNEDIRQLDSTIAVNSYKFLKDKFDTIEKNTRDELGDIKKHQKEYNKRMYDAAQDFFDKVSVLDLNPEGDYMKEALEIVARYPKPKETTSTISDGGDSKKKGPKTDTDKVQDAIDDYNEGLTSLGNRLNAGTITQKEYDDELNKLEDKTWETITAISNFIDILKKLKQEAFGESLAQSYGQNRVDEGARNIAKQLVELGKYSVPKKQERDTSRDWAKTNDEIAEEEVKVQFDYKETLDKLISDFREAIDNGDFNLVKDDALDMLDELKEKAQEAANEADNLQTKLDLSKVVSKLDEQIKALDQTAMSTMESVSQAMDRIVQGLMSIAQVFDEDLKDSPLFQGIEAFTSVMNSGIQIMQASLALIELVDALKKKSAKDTVKNSIMEIAANEAVAISEKKKAGAAGMAAVSEGAESVASIPYVGPILAVAAAATILGALLAAFSKFANGGIVGGNNYGGDNNVVRVNSGEMIINRGDQEKLWRFIHNGSNAGGGQVEFKIRGADLVGTLNNYNRIRS